MKTNLLSKIIKIWLFAIACVIGSTLSVHAQNDVLFTNVNPIENLLTITNPTGATIDLSDYQLCLGPGTYRRIGDLPPVSGNIMLEAGENLVLSYGLNNTQAGLSLFSEGGNFGSTDPTILIDFVQWGDANQPRSAQAVAAGRWDDGNNFVTGAFPYTTDTGGTAASWSSTVDGGTLTGGPFEILVEDNVPSMIPAGSLTLEGEVGSESQYVITDDQGTILGLPPTLAAVEGVDFDDAGTGTCLIWHISHDGSLSGAMMGATAPDDLSGNFDLSNAIEVVRKNVSGGTLSGGPFEFTVDNDPDMIMAGELTLDGEFGSNMSYVVTDADLNIITLPADLEALQMVDFNGAGVGVCLVWHISHDGTLTGAAAGQNAANLGGNFDLSNPVTVVRASTDPVDGGTLTGGPFEFTVDGTPDMIMAGEVTLADAVGANMSYVITDADLNILGLPPTLTDLEGVNFDDAGPGVCLIWHISHDGSLSGAEVGNNAGDLLGNFDLSNSIEVVRPSTATVSGGTLSGGPFQFCAEDGTADTIAANEITLEGAAGTQMGWVITNANGEILGLPASFTDVNFDTAGAGTCLVWHISHDGSLAGAVVGATAPGDLRGNFSLSNSITVERFTGNDCQTLSTNDLQKDLISQVFPVPASNMLNVQLTEVSNNSEIVLYNFLGQTVKSLKAENNRLIQIDVNDLSKGVYILSLINEIGQERFTKQVVKN